MSKSLHLDRLTFDRGKGGKVGMRRVCPWFTVYALQGYNNSGFVTCLHTDRMGITLPKHLLLIVPVLPNATVLGHRAFMEIVLVKMRSLG